MAYLYYLLKFNSDLHLLTSELEELKETKHEKTLFETH
jgi:hypothetical protein